MKNRIGIEVPPESNPGKRLWNLGEGLIFAVIFAGLYWLLGAIIKSIAGKEIRIALGYLVAIFLGFLFRNALITMLSN